MRAAILLGVTKIKEVLSKRQVTTRLVKDAIFQWQWDNTTWRCWELKEMELFPFLPPENGGGKKIKKMKLPGKNYF